MASLARQRILPAAALAVLILGLSAQAAPLPKPSPSLPKLDKYLLDDTDFVLVVNVKGIQTTPLYTKHFKKDLEGLLAKEEVKTVLAGVGLKPLQDVERVVFFIGRSCHAKEGERPGSDTGPLILVQGKFDGAKLHAKLAKLAEAKPDRLKVHSEGGAKIYELVRPRDVDFRNPFAGMTGFAALLDRNSILMSGKKEAIVEALAKAAGKKKTALKVKGLAAGLKTLKPESAVQAVGAGEMIVSSSYSSVKGGGKDSFKVTHHTLAESGFTKMEILVNAKEEFQGKVVLTLKNKGELKKLEKKFTDGLNQVRTEGRREIARMPQLAPLLTFLDNVTIKTGDGTLILEGNGGAPVIKAMVHSLFRSDGP
jgi:hypothetical protein